MECRLLIILIGLGVSQIVTSAETGKTLPFLVKTKTRMEIPQKDISYCIDAPTDKTVPFSKEGSLKEKRIVLAEAAQEKAVNIDTEKILNTIKNIKKDLCAILQNGNVKFWIKSDLEGKFLGIGGSTESGIEVNVQCDLRLNQ